MRRLTLAAPVGVLVPLVLLLGLSAFLRTRSLDASLWIDEGISVGIASHPVAELPGLLRQDGSPPAYYLLLHAWTALAGTGEAVLRAPSLVFALLTVPVGLWGGWSLFGRRAGWLCASFAAVTPFLTSYAQEARMYALVALLSVLATAAFLHAFVFSRRRYLPVFAALLALLLYTHYWALFYALGMLVTLGALLATAPPASRARLLRDGALGFGLPGLAFLPWLPTFAFQLEHTGAPWSNPPPTNALLWALALAAGAIVVARLGEDADERRALWGLALAGAVTLAAGWASSHVEPSWANRYLAVLVGPLLLLAGATFARVGRLGLVAGAAVALVWALDLSPDEKSNVADASAGVAARLEPGDLVVSTQPEQVPVLAHYLPQGLRYATPLGPVPDPRVMDWRNALPRLERTRPERSLTPLLDSLPPGSRVLLVAPAVGDGSRWQAPWTSLVVRRSAEWEAAMRGDSRFRRLDAIPPGTDAAETGVGVTLYRRIGR